MIMHVKQNFAITNCTTYSTNNSFIKNNKIYLYIFKTLGLY